MGYKEIKMKKTIVLCSSASFFKKLFEIKRRLEALGFQVKLPYTAMKMKHSGDFRVETYKVWFRNPKSYARKSWLIRNHFQKIISSHAVLIVNYEKNGIGGYIGGNTLIEMAIAYHYKKPIYILNSISDKLGFREEVLGLQPIFLNGDAEK